MPAGLTAPSPPRLEPVVLTGRVVVLEPLAAHHRESFAAGALRDPTTWDFMRSRIATPADADRQLEKALAGAVAGLELPFAVIERATGAFLGSTSYLDYHPPDRWVEIGSTWYIPEARGGEVNPECKLLLLRHAFGPLHCQRVQLKTDARNARSRAAIAKLGARQEGVLRKHMIVQDSFARDSVYFGLTDDEWPAAEAHLVARVGMAEGPAVPGR